MRLRLASIVVVTLLFILPAFSIFVNSGGAPPTNQAPIAYFTYSPSYPAPDGVITFDASASYDPDGSIVQYGWNFGDGSTITVVNPVTSHTYLIDGNYTVELTVTDNGGAKSVSTVVIQVSTEVFFMVNYYGTLIPMSNVEVTVYYYNGISWVKAPTGSDKLEIRYDKMTEPDLANTPEEKYRNPAFTANVLRSNASNVGFDIHPSSWYVYFKFQWGGFVTYWPNETTRVYTYNNGVVEAHDYSSDKRAVWSSTAGTYVIKAKNIPSSGVSPSQNHPIIVGALCPPPQKRYYLTVRTDPVGITTIPGEGLYNEGTNVTLTAPTYVDVSANMRYRFNYWDIDGASQGSGVNPINVNMGSNHTATAHYVTQYCVSFNQTGISSDATGTVVIVDGSNKAYGDLPFNKWVDSGSSVTYSYSSPVSSTVTGKRYRLNGVTGPSSPITVTGPATVVGNYVTQYMVTFAQTGLDSTATGTVVTVNSSAKIYSNLPYSFWADYGSSVTYSYSSIVSSTVTGQRFSLAAIHCPPSPFTVTGPTTITGEYCKQYQVTFAQSGLDSSATGTVVTVNGTAKTISDLPYSFWVNSGSSVTYSYSSPVSSTMSGKRFNLASVSGPASPISVTSPTTVTGNYIVQYLVTFSQSGMDSTATGTVATVNGSSKAYGDLPYSLWANGGSSVTYSYSSPVSSSVSGKRFRLNTVSGPTSPITVTGPTTVTGNYVTQYLVTFNHTGLDSTATGSVVIVNGGSKTYSDLPYIIWVDSGSSVTYSYSSPVSSSVSGKRFRLNTVTGPASPITVTGATTVTGNYVTQYLVTFTHSGLDSTATGTVVTVNSDAKTYTELPYTIWVDSGSSITYLYNDVVLSTTTGKRFKLLSVTGPSSPITVTSSITVTGNYKIQYQVTFDQSGVGSDFTGTVLTLDTTNYNVNGLPVSFWWDKDSNHNFAFASPLVVNATKQYSWSSTTGLSTLQSGTLTTTASGSVIGNYVVGNRVTFDQIGASSDFTGTVVAVDGTSYGISQLPVSFIWQVGTVHNFSFQSPLLVSSNSKQYVWTSTSGLSTQQSGSITVTTYGSIIANYKTQYYLTLTTNPPGLTSPSGSGWYDSGTYSPISTQQYVPGGSRYRFDGWVTADMSEITDPSSQSTTVLVDQPKTVTANYVHQYLITFTHSGLTSDATGTVVTVDSIGKTYSDLPYSVWVDEGSTLNYAYQSPVSSSVSGKRFSLINVTGPSSPITVNADTTVTGNYKTQYYLTVSSPYGTTGGQGWYDSGATAYASLASGTVDLGNGTRRVFTNWNGDTSGTNYAQSNPITMNGPKNAVANWKTQYSVIFNHTGLDSSASGTVVTVNGAPKTYSDLPYSLWTDESSTVTYTYGNVSSSTTGKRFILTGISGSTSPITVTSPTTVVGNYKTQYQITFNQSGIGSDFTSTVLTVDGNGYTVSTLPTAFWWDSGSSHDFAYYSPLIVNAGKQYVWTSTTGLSALQNGTLTTSGSGSITGNYAAEIKYQITFDQTGVSLDFSETVATIDGINYTVTDLPISFWWDADSSHTFAYYSPLTIAPDSKQYVWVSTSGPWPTQTGSITITASATVVGNYKIQYYLTLATDPIGVTSPSGEGWYDANTNATISTSAFVDIVSGSSRYRFNGWTTADMPEIADPTRSPTEVLMDKAKTVTANYVIQYVVSFDKTGVGPEFTGNIVAVDGLEHNVSSLPVSLWWDKDSNHDFAYHSPLAAIPNIKQYAWASTSGPWPIQGGTITVTTNGNVVGNYKTQYFLTVSSPYGSPTPTSGWFDNGANIVASVTTPWTGPTDTRYACIGWTGTGSVPPSGGGPPATFTITQASSITWNWKTQYYLAVKTNPPGIATIPGEDWYDASATATLTAPPVTNYQFSYWDVDGTSRGNGVNPITVTMNAPHTATAHYTPQVQSYTLTIVTTTGGTTNPVPGSYTYIVNSNVQVSALPNLGYTFGHWELDSINVGSTNPYTVIMNMNHTLTAIFTAIPPPQISINPLDKAIPLGQSVGFTSTITGGTAPYSYQWYLGNNPVPGATSGTWTFNPTSDGTYYVYLKVTDANNNTVQSATAKVTVTSVPVGGYSNSLISQTPLAGLMLYAAIIALFGAALSLTRRKKK